MSRIVRLVAAPALIIAIVLGFAGAGTAPEPTLAGCPTTTQAQNEALVHRWYDEVWSGGNLDVLDSILSPQHAHHWATGPDTYGAAEVKERIAEVRVLNDAGRYREGLERAEVQHTDLAPSTWGHGKDLSTWDSPRVGHMAVAARRAELRTVTATAGHARPRAALERAARELLAVQASDWAFMTTRELAGDYPGERLQTHSANLDAALSALADSAGVPPDPALRNLAPDLDLASLTSP